MNITMKCPVCEVDFVPRRSDAKTCGKPACQKKLQRMSKDEVSVPSASPEAIKAANPTHDKWGPLDRSKMTQAEVESYYTLENFPNLKYGPANSPNPPHMRSRRD